MGSYESLKFLGDHKINILKKYGVTERMLNRSVIADIVSVLQNNENLLINLLKNLDPNAEDPLRQLLYIQRKGDHEYQIKNEKDVYQGKNIIEGTTVCPNCGSKKINMRIVQSRASDEPATTFFDCVNCGRKWRR